MFFVSHDAGLIRTRGLSKIPNNQYRQSQCQWSFLVIITSCICVCNRKFNKEIIKLTWNNCWGLSRFLCKCAFRLVRYTWKIKEASVQMSWHLNLHQKSLFFNTAFFFFLIFLVKQCFSFFWSLCLLST